MCGSGCMLWHKFSVMFNLCCLCVLCGGQHCVVIVYVVVVNLCSSPLWCACIWCGVLLVLCGIVCALCMCGGGGGCMTNNMVRHMYASVSGMSYVCL